ncbi:MULTISPECIES: hypothetical protein [unclassified Caballeronia]|uniref:hypothetical protein n=1 Tax=unclassified Caballeronia TaxID=2646786 RepID=UPI002028454C|nr:MULTISPECIES: hypothetical protein [unclassified Caballeronia]
MTITKDEWIERAVKRYIDRSDLAEEDARTSAESLFGLHPDTSPEDAVDEDMTYWGE